MRSEFVGGCSGNRPQRTAELISDSVRATAKQLHVGFRKAPVPMRITGTGWQAWLARGINDMQSPARLSMLTWIAILICAAVFVVWFLR